MVEGQCDTAGDRARAAGSVGRRNSRPEADREVDIDLVVSLAERCALATTIEESEVYLER
jgi:hypothetical protein